MESNMDRSLDEILADRKKSNNGRNQGRGRSNNSGGGGSRRRERRDEYPRDGIRKSYRDDPRKIDEEWVHDRFDDDEPPRHRSSRNTRASPERSSIARGTRIRVDNLHYELTREDLEGLFQAIGPVRSVELVYDRAGRSEGVAYVTYETYNDAKAAVAEYDGANAKGQPIHLAIVPSTSGNGRRGNNPFDSAVKPGTGRPLAERITRPRGRRGQDGDDDDYNGVDGEDDGDEADDRNSVAAAARRGIDRYVPSGGGRDRSRSPRPRRREGGRRPGERRGGGRDRDRDRDRDGRSNGNNNHSNSNSNSQNGGNSRRPRKTAEELDAEMDNYFGSGGGGGGGGSNAPAAAAAPTAAAAEDPEDDTDMIG